MWHVTVLTAELFICLGKYTALKMSYLDTAVRGPPGSRYVGAALANFTAQASM